MPEPEGYVYGGFVYDGRVDAPIAPHQVGKVVPVSLAHDGGFEQALETLINCHSRENGSNTPDFILARYLCACLDAWNAGVNRRESWSGRKLKPCKSPVPPC